MQRIKNEKDYEWALERIGELADASPGSKEEAEYNRLISLVSEYVVRQADIPFGGYSHDSWDEE